MPVDDKTGEAPAARVDEVAELPEHAAEQANLTGPSHLALLGLSLSGNRMTKAKRRLWKYQHRVY